MSVDFCVLKIYFQHQFSIIPSFAATKDLFRFLLLAFNKYYALRKYIALCPIKKKETFPAACCPE